MLRKPIWCNQVPFLLYYDKSFGGLSSDMQMEQTHESPFLPNPTKNKLTAKQSGSGLQETTIGNWVMILVAKKSIFDEESCFLHKNQKTESLNFHSVWISCLRNFKSASKFCTPGRWVAESKMMALAAQAHISWARESHSKDLLVPNLWRMQLQLQWSYHIAL